MSIKIKSSIEVTIGIVFIFGYLWLIHPLYSQWVKVFCAIPILLFFVCSNFLDSKKNFKITKKSFKENGFRLDNWYYSFKILIIFTSITVPVLYVIWQLFFPVNNYFYKDFSFWKKLIITFPIGALFQEYVFLSFFFRRYRDIFFPHTNFAVFFSALTFSVIHIPTPPLIIFCFFAGIVWAITYNKYPNLFTIAVSHAVLGAFCSSVLLVPFSVGSNADIGRWSDNDGVYGCIYKVNDIDAHKGKYVNINHENENIFVQGYIASTEKINNMQISLGGKDYSLHHGDKSMDVATHFNNPDFLYSGFSATIPISNFPPGYHKLILKVYIENELFSYSPGESVWVKITAN
ncbi:MAG: CPBP family intramembrane metalloprotease [Desulfobacteraceae bacterium]|nr:CPBP family intramembrane metalloprotease [Desulfobacteraceae bacterium]